MSIEFVVEDGTGKSDATSYASLDQFRQYWLNKGTDYTSTSDDTIKAYLNSATEYIDSTYTFRSYKTNTDQALEWPRYNVRKNNYEYVYYDYYDSDEIPTNLINAACYIAAKVSSGELFGTESNIQSISYNGISKTFTSNNKKTNYNAVEKLLKNLIINGIKMVRVN